VGGPNVATLESKVRALIALGRPREAVATLDEALTLFPESTYLLATQGVLLRASGRNQEAAEALRGVLDIEPENATARVVLTDILLDLGRTEEALAVIDSSGVVPGSDSYPLIVGTRGQVLRALGRNEEAVRELRRAVRLDDTLGWAYIELGEGLRRLGRHQEALAALDRALVLAPDDAWAVGTRGQVLRMLGRTEEAVGELRRAALLDPRFPWVYQELANALRHLSRYEEALSALDQALALAPDHPWAVGTRGQVLRMLGRTEEAADELRRALAMDDSMAWAHAELGESLRLLGRYEEALSALDQAVSLGYGPPWVSATMGAVLQELDQYDEAIDALDLALEAVPSYPWALAMKASAHCDIAEYEQALTLLDRAIELDPADWMFGLKGWALRNLETGDARQVKEAYEQALRIDPTWPWWREGRAEALWMMGEREEAEREYRALVAGLTADPSEADGQTLGLVGWCHLMLGDFRRAAGILSQAMVVDNDPSFRFDVGLALLCAGSAALARQAYRRALDDAAQASALRQRGLFQVAWVDLSMGLRLQPSLEGLPVVQEIRRLLTEHTSRVWRRRTGRKRRAVPVVSKPEVGAMADTARELRVQIEPQEGADADELAGLAAQLRRELAGLDVQSVELERAGEVPEDAKAVDVLALGGLVVKLGPVAVGVVARVVQGWLRRASARSVKLQLDGDVIELTGASSQDQERLISLMEAKHGQR
jgi:tetratricopeptide (TPR) repeat protein